MEVREAVLTQRQSQNTDLLIISRTIEALSQQSIPRQDHALRKYTDTLDDLDARSRLQRLKTDVTQHVPPQNVLTIRVREWVPNVGLDPATSHAHRDGIRSAVDGMVAFCCQQMFRAVAAQPRYTDRVLILAAHHLLATLGDGQSDCSYVDTGGSGDTDPAVFVRQILTAGGLRTDAAVDTTTAHASGGSQCGSRRAQPTDNGGHTRRAEDIVDEDETFRDPSVFCALASTPGCGTSALCTHVVRQLLQGGGSDTHPDLLIEEECETTRPVTLIVRMLDTIDRNAESLWSIFMSMAEQMAAIVHSSQGPTTNTDKTTVLADAISTLSAHSEDERACIDCFLDVVRISNDN